MLSIRFTRVGRKKAPSYRIVVMDKKKDPWSNYIEKVGFYNPKTKETVLKEDRIKYWLSVGAQASNTVSNLLLKNGIIEDIKKKAVKISKKRQTNIDNKKKTIEEERAKKEAKALADEEAKIAKEAEVSAEETKTEEVIEETPKTESASTEAVADEEAPTETIEEKTE